MGGTCARAHTLPRAPHAAASGGCRVRTTARCCGGPSSLSASATLRLRPGTRRAPSIRSQRCARSPATPRALATSMDLVSAKFPRGPGAAGPQIVFSSRTGRAPRLEGSLAVRRTVCVCGLHQRNGPPPASCRKDQQGGTLGTSPGQSVTRLQAARGGTAKLRRTPARSRKGSLSGRRPTYPSHTRRRGRRMALMGGCAVHPLEAGVAGHVGAAADAQGAGEAGGV